MEEEKKTFGIYIGVRDESFKDLISNILGEDLSKKYKKTLLSESSLSYFSTAFTHPNADFHNNYNFLKALGHVSFQKNIVWYLSRNKIVVSDKTKLEKTITDYKIRLIKSLGKMTVMNIFDFISIDKKHKTNVQGNSEAEEKIIQAVLEAFFGAVELILDRDYGIGIGNQIVYGCITRLFDEYVEIEESIEKDPKTKLNEIFISNKNILGVPKYEEVEYKDGIYSMNLFQILPNGQKILIGQGIDKPKRQAEKKAAKQAIDKNIFYAYNSSTGQVFIYHI
jgi:dsRNA-specific ribonuclease